MLPKPVTMPRSHVSIINVTNNCVVSCLWLEQKPSRKEVGKVFELQLNMNGV